MSFVTYHLEVITIFSVVTALVFWGMSIRFYRREKALQKNFHAVQRELQNIQKARMKIPAHSFSMKNFQTMQVPNTTTQPESRNFWRGPTIRLRAIELKDLDVILSSPDDPTPRSIDMKMRLA